MAISDQEKRYGAWKFEKVVKIYVLFLQAWSQL